MKILKKLYYYLYGVYFILKLNVRTLVYQLNCANTNLFGVLINNWLAWIQLFNFEIYHIPGKYHVLPDALSRRLLAETDLTNDKNINEFVKRALVIRHKVCPIGVINPTEAGRQNGAINKNVKILKDSLEQAPLGVNNLSDEGPGLITLNPDSQYLLKYLYVMEYLISLC